MGQTPDNKFLIAGGVFSSVQGLPQVFFYDIADDPYHPLYTGDIDPKNSGITDQVVVDNQGRAIITQVGSNFSASNLDSKVFRALRFSNFQGFIPWNGPQEQRHR